MMAKVLKGTFVRRDGSESDSHVVRPDPDDALYEVTIWNHTTAQPEKGILTTGRNLAAAVDEAMAWFGENIGETEDDLFLTVGRA